MLEVLREIMGPRRPVRVPGLPPFSGGAVGYFGYDAVRWFEKLPAEAQDDLGIDTAAVMFFSSLLAFDHVKHQIQIIANVFAGESRDDLREKYIAACHVRSNGSRRLSRHHSNLRRRRAVPGG